MKIHNFEKSMKQGKAGEETIVRYIQSIEGVRRLYDVRENKAYQMIDIDFILETRGGKQQTLEVKADSYTTGNIFYETLSNVEHNIPGCMYKTRAEYLYYYFTVTGELYILDMVEYRKWVESEIRNPQTKLERKKLKNRSRSNGVSHTEGYLIPKSYLEQNFKRFIKRRVSC